MAVKLVLEPRVYVVGRQKVDADELGRFLVDCGSRGWTTDTDVSAEVLVEVAGRNCYTSYKRPCRGWNKTYIKHILEAGHGCYDEGTDVLTSVGWVPFPEAVELAKSGLEFATRREDGIIEYRCATGVVKEPYHGRMYRVESQGVDLLVTPNHNILACPMTTKEGRNRQNFRLIRADELGTASHCYTKIGEWQPHDSSLEPWSTLELAMLGFAIGDGYLSPRGRTVRFHLRRPRKIAWLSRVATLLGWQLTEDGDRFTVGVPDQMKHLFASIYDNAGEKQIPQHLLLRSSPEQLRGLFDGLMESDGHRGRTGDSFDTTSQKLAGQFQQLCLHLGIAANIGYTIDAERRISSGSFGVKPLTRLQVVRRNLLPQVNKFDGCHGRSRWIEDWEGTVYCVDVPNHTLYVRRNGKPVWCGNSVIEHASWSFLITGVSRSLTHELVRHRHMSYSQRSQRYVDESEVAFVVPPALMSEVTSANALSDSLKMGGCDRLTDSERVGLGWIASAERDLDEYIALVEYLSSGDRFPGITDRTERRKAAREAARSVLPNSTETSIFVTANARALRNFLELRGSRHADAEMARLSVRLLGILQAESPNIFGEYRLVDIGNGRQEIITDYRKV